MRACRSLPVLYDMFEKRVFRLLAVHKAVLAAPTDCARDRSTAYCALEMSNAWGGFLRAYYVSAASGARRRSGARVRLGSRPSFTSEIDAVMAAIRVQNPAFTKRRYTSYDEPDWNSKSVVIRIATNLSMSNLVEIRRGFAMASRIRDRMAPVRNFYAHRSERTALRVKNVAKDLRIPSVQRATDLLCSLLPGKPITVFEQWVIECTRAGYEICA